jgi:hypothetical protein
VGRSGKEKRAVPHGLPAVSDDEGTRRHRIRFDMGLYSDNKSAIKAPIKDQDLTWQFLGREQGNTKGRYSGDDVEVFALYTDEHADFTVQGTDEEAIEAILSAWDEFPHEEVDEDEEEIASPADEEEEVEVAVWKFKKPTRRPGEPEHFYERRLEDWKAKDPRS